MSSGKKILLGVLSFIPLILFGAWLYSYVQWIVNFIPNAATYEADPNGMLRDMGGLLRMSFSLLLPAGLLALGLMIYYLIQIVNNRALPDGERVVWIIVIVVFNIVAFPIYWIMRIRKLPSAPQHATAAQSPQEPQY